MKFFVYHPVQGQTVTRKPLSPEAMVEIGKFMEESLRSGIAVTSGWLPSTSTRVHLAEGKVSVTDGPFIEGKELIPGFAVIEVPTREEALAWVMRFRGLLGDGESRVAQIAAPG